MSDSAQRHEIATKKVCLEIPGMDAVVRRQHVCSRPGGGKLLLDLCYPPTADDDERPRPAVVFVSGYPDAGMRRVLGCRAMDMESSRSWAALVAASGMIGIAYATEQPGDDLRRLMRCLEERGTELGVDPARIGLWACSGHVPTALAALMRPSAARCAALWYGFLLDAEGATAVSDAAGRFGFHNPVADCAVEDLDPTVPLLIVRAGADAMPGLNAALDRFVADTLRRNRPLTLVNYPEGAHAFDILDGGAGSQKAIRLTLAFLQQELIP